jgi:hypothetical protein
MKRISIIVFFCLAFKFGWTQNTSKIPDESLHKDSKLSVEVKCNDSACLMIPQLTILSKEKIIQIHKKLLYTDGAGLGDCSFSLQKLVKCVFVELHVNGFRDPIYDSSYSEFRNYKYGDSLKDSIDLGEFIPIEVGKYMIICQLTYYIKGQEYSIQSAPYYFDVASELKSIFCK